MSGRVVSTVLEVLSQHLQEGDRVTLATSSPRHDETRRIRSVAVARRVVLRFEAPVGFTEIELDRDVVVQVQRG